jgi:NIPSNAP protein
MININDTVLTVIVAAFCFITALVTNAQNSSPTTPQAQPATPVLAASPSLSRDSRCFELRTYNAPPGKLEELHARFRNHTLALFKKHGMEVVGFWGPTDKDKGSENTLVYILAFPSREAREKSWQEFRADPAWQAVVKESEKNGKLTEKIDSVIMKATDYSPVK